MLGRLSPQSQEERELIVNSGFDPDQILSCDELVTSKKVFFAATGISGGPLLRSVRYSGRYVETHSLLLRAATGTIRFIEAEHAIDN